LKPDGRAAPGPKAPKVKPSPLLGQHVDDVLGSWLGMDSKELTALRQEGIV
jgi:formyl-CoA transferase